MGAPGQIKPRKGAAPAQDKRSRGIWPASIAGLPTPLAPRAGPLAQVHPGLRSPTRGEPDGPRDSADPSLGCLTARTGDTYSLGAAALPAVAGSPRRPRSGSSWLGGAEGNLHEFEQQLDWEARCSPSCSTLAQGFSSTEPVAATLSRSAELEALALPRLQRISRRLTTFNTKLASPPRRL